MVYRWFVFALIFFICFALGNTSGEKERSYLEEHKDSKGHGGAALFFKYHQAIRTRSGDKQPGYGASYQYEAFRKAINAPNPIKLRTLLPWKERGPGNVGGRTRTILVDPDDPTHLTWLTGTASGGVWKTTDGGMHWQPLTDHLPALAASQLAMAASDPNIIYLGTGEGYTRLGVNGQGIWKSTDKGATWFQLLSTANNPIHFGNIMRIIVNPDNPDELLVAGRPSLFQTGDDLPLGYILKSEDGGNSWTIVHTAARPIQQIIADPLHFNVQYATVDSLHVLRSRDTGNHWDTIFNASNLKWGRMELAIAPSNPNPKYIYISAESEKEDFELYKSTDQGKNWNKVIGVDEGNQFGPVFNNSQGWYDNAIAVDPYDPEVVLVGGAGPVLRIYTSNSATAVKVEELQISGDFWRPIPIPGATDGIQLPAQLKIFTGVTPDDYVDVGILFGKGQRQNIHRFVATAKDISGEYKDYIPMPFEVLDLTHNRQLYASFIDANENGIWDLVPAGGDPEKVEPLIVSNIPYRSAEPDPAIAEDMFHQALFALYLGTKMPENPEWEKVQGAFIGIYPEKLLGALMEPVVDGYRQYPAFGVSGKGVHVDHHQLVCIPVEERTKQYYLLDANDGGVAFSKDNGTTFVQTGDTYDIGLGNTLRGYNTAQFYGIDKMNGGDRYIGGTQDNGSWLSPSDPDKTSIWLETPSADGFEAVWHYEDSLKMMQSSQNNIIRKSIDGGKTWKRVSIPGGGPFITRLAASKSDPELVFGVSSLGVARSTDFGENWTITEMPEQWLQDIFGPPIEISLASTSVVWTGGAIDSLHRLMVSSNKGLSFRPTTGYNEAVLGRISGIATHPFDPKTAYALFSMADGPKILKTADLGQTWRDLSGFVHNRSESTNGFPDVATYSLLVMPFDTSILWAGTEIGLFESLNGGLSWHYADNGLPAVAIWEMKIVNEEIVLATHGRGVWTVKLPELKDLEPPITTSVENTFSDLLNSTIFPNPVENDLNLRFYLPYSGRVTIDLVALDGKSTYQWSDQYLAKGEHQLGYKVDGLTSGLYFVRLVFDHQIQITRKIVVLTSRKE